MTVCDVTDTDYQQAGSTTSGYVAPSSLNVRTCTVLACKVSGLKVHTYTPESSVFDGPVANPIPVLCI